MRPIALAFLFLLGVTDCLAQWRPGEDVAGTRQVASYSYGVGRLEWTFPAGLYAIFAVPHWTAGPRVKCGSEKPGQEIECEVEVQPRSLEVSREQRRRELLSGIEPLLAESKEKTARTQSYGDDMMYVVLEHAKATGHDRYFAVGFAHRSTALLKFHAKFGDRAALPSFLELVASAKAIDALPMWAWRLGDYRAVCTERYPELKEANDRAFKASPFASVDVPAFFFQRIESPTPEKVRDMLDKGRRGFAAEFDRGSVEQKRAFCEGFPEWVAEASRGI